MVRRNFRRHIPLFGRHSRLVVIASAVIAIGIGAYYITRPLFAATVNLVPSAVVSNGWTTSSAGTAPASIAEGATPNVNDYIGVASTGGGNEAASFEIGDLSNADTVSNLSVRVYARSATNANGGTLDSVSVGLTVGGVAQTAQVITPAYSASTTWSWYQLEFPGTWTMAQANNAQISVTRSILGSGSPSKQADTVQIASIYVQATYTLQVSLTQNSYRLFAAGSAGSPQDVGSPLAAVDTGAIAPASGTPFRLRMNLGANSGPVPSGAPLKLQAAPRGTDGACDPSFTGETYADVGTPGGTPRFAGTAVNDNTTGSGLWTSLTSVSASDGTYANYAPPIGANGTSQYLKATNFGFSIPSDATINGITVTVKRYSDGTTGSDVSDNSARIVKGGVVGSTNYSIAGGWPASPTDATYGSSATLWGDSWTPADINSSGFGFALSANSTYNPFDDANGQAHIDSITIRVSYSSSQNPALEFYDVATVNSGGAYVTNANDPVRSGVTSVPQTYNESNPFATSSQIPSGQDGLWDFSLMAASGAAPGTYCLRAIKADGSMLTGYTILPEVTILYPADQSNYAFYDNADSTTPGTLLSINTPLSRTEGTPFRLRQLLRPTSGSIATSTQFKLQAAEKAGTCDASTYFNVNDGVESSGDSGYLFPANAPAQVQAEDGVTYDQTGSGGVGDVTGIGASIPESSVVKGVEVRVVRRGVETGYGPYDTDVRLVKGGVAQGVNHAPVNRQIWSTVMTAVTYGGPTDTWGVNLKPEDINSSAFGLWFLFGADYDAYIDGYATAQVDAIQIKVYYQIQSTGVIYSTNLSVADNAAISTTANDPGSVSGAIIPESYQQANPITIPTAVAPGQNGLWDFSLTGDTGTLGKTYCLRVAQANGDSFTNYTRYPEVTFVSPVTLPTIDQQLRGGQAVINGVKSPFSF